MPDRSLPASTPPPPETSPPPFQRRLTVTLGAALGGALFLLGAAALLGAWAFLNYTARTHLGSEVTNIAIQVVQGDALDLDAPPWNEPHHRYIERHIDPHFVQVFDAEGHPIRFSTNVARLGDRFPARLLPVTDSDAGIAPLRTFEADSLRYYHLTTPLRTDEGRLLGYLQVSRYEPGIPAMLGQIGLGIGAGYLVLLASLLALLWTVGGRVVRPLALITERARHLSPEHLSQRVPIPADADRETAELGRALNAALARMEAAFEEVHRFTADAAHELQTPLTVLLGHIEVTLRRERDPDAYRETLRILRQEAEAMIRTVRGLLTLARLERARGASEPVDLAQIAHDEAEAARPRAQQKGLALTVDAESDAAVRGHPALLREAVRNLLDNAIKYTETGEVHIGLHQANGDVTLAVEDTGIGMVPEQVPHAARRFWRADDVQHLPGSGLGLALVDQVAAHHGGRLHLHSQPGAGTRAELTLPIRYEHL